jgi:hypothetical protein
MGAGLALSAMGMAVPVMASEQDSNLGVLGAKAEIAARINTDQTASAPLDDAGYFRVVVSPNYNHLNLCPDSRQKGVIKGKLWNMLFNSTVSWGTNLAVQMPETQNFLYGQRRDFEVPIARAKIAGSWKNCTSDVALTQAYYGPLVPVRDEGVFLSSSNVQVTLNLWYTRQTDGSRVDSIWGKLTAALGSFIPGANLLLNTVTGGSKGLTDSLNDDSHESSFPQILNPQQFNARTIFAGLEGLGSTADQRSFDGSLSVKLQSYASVFSTDGNFPNLVDVDYDDILGGVLIVPGPTNADGTPGSTTRRKIAEFLPPDMLTAVAAQKTPETFTPVCQMLVSQLQSVGFTKLDALIFAWAQGQKNGIKPHLLKQVKCFASNSTLLNKVQINLSQITTPDALRKATDAERQAIVSQLKLLITRMADDEFTRRYFSSKIRFSGNLDKLQELIGVDGTLVTRENVANALGSKLSIIGCALPISGVTDAVAAPDGMEQVTPLSTFVALLVKDKNDQARVLTIALGGVSTSAADAVPAIEAIHVSDVATDPERKVWAASATCRSNTWTLPALGLPAPAS